MCQMLRTANVLALLESGQRCLILSARRHIDLVAILARATRLVAVR